MRTLKIGTAAYKITAALATTIGTLAAQQRTDATIETSTVTIDGVDLVLPKAMVDAMLAGIGVGAPMAAEPTDPAAMDDADPVVDPNAPKPPAPPRMDAASIAKLVDTAVKHAVDQVRADMAHASSVERRATEILGASPTGTDVWATMVEAVSRLDGDRKASAEALAVRARRGDMRAAGQLEGLMDALPRTDAAERSDAASSLGRAIDQGRRDSAPRGKDDAPKTLESARQAARQRKLDAGKPRAAAV